MWIFIGLILALIATVLLYYHFLLSLYPEKIQTEEVHTVKTPDLWNLRVCRYRRGRIEGQPVLLVHGSMSNHHNFTSPEGACLIEHLVNKGYDCWAVDLRGCRSSIPPFERNHLETTLDQQLMFDLPSVVQYIRRVSGYNKIHWVGHSLGGMLLYAYSQVHGEEHIASGTTMGSPLGFEGVQLKIPESLLFLVRHRPRLVCAVVKALMPLGMLFKWSLPYFPANLKNIPPQMNTGHFINMLEAPLPKVQAELAFWVRNQVWRMLDDRINIQAGLKTMTFPLLAIYAPMDPFVPLRRAAHFFQQLPHNDKKYLVCSKDEGCLHDYNHCDLAFGKNGVREVFEPIANWIKEHSTTERFIVDSDHNMTGNTTWTTPLLSEERAKILSGEHVDDDVNQSETIHHTIPFTHEEALPSAADEGDISANVNEMVLRFQQSTSQAAKQSKADEAETKAFHDAASDATPDNAVEADIPVSETEAVPPVKQVKKKPAPAKASQKKNTAKKKTAVKKTTSMTTSNSPADTTTQPPVTDTDQTAAEEARPLEKRSEKSAVSRKTTAIKGTVKKSPAKKTSTSQRAKSTDESSRKATARKTSATRESSVARSESETGKSSEDNTQSTKNIELPQATRRAIAQAGDLMRAFSEPPKSKTEDGAPVDSSRVEE